MTSPSRSSVFEPATAKSLGRDSHRSASDRYDTIDLLRGWSILSVVLLHCSLWLSFSNYELGSNFPKWLRFIVFSDGGNGVSAFFAISGFLITLVSLRRFGSLGHMRPMVFYRIRFARIAPMLGLLLMVLSALHLAHVSSFVIKPAVSTLPRTLFAAITFQLNWFEAVHGWLPPCWTVLWSLSVEEMFYLFFPLLCWMFLRRSWGWPVFIVLLLAFVIFGPFARQPWYTTNDIWAYQSYFGNVDNIALGCLTAIVTERLAKNSSFVSSKWPLFLQLLGSILTLYIAFEWPRVVFGWRIFRILAHSATDTTVLGIGVCLIMLGSVLRQTAGRPWTLPIRWIGRYSYEVYLTHEFVVIGVLNRFLVHRTDTIALWIGAVVILSAGLGYLLARFVSEPTNRRVRGAPLPSESSQMSNSVASEAS